MTRERLPAERPSIVRRFSLPYVDDDRRPARLKFLVIAGMHEDRRLAEIFIHTDRKNDQASSLIAGLLDAIATAISIGLQYGAPLETFTAKFRHSHFGPSGFTGDKAFPSCTSLLDLITQWLVVTFPNGAFGGAPT